MVVGCVVVMLCVCILLEIVAGVLGRPHPFCDELRRGEGAWLACELLSTSLS